MECYLYSTLETDKTEPAARQPLSARLTGLVEKYGRLALVIYFILFGLVFGAFIVAIGAGWHVQTTAGRFGLVGAAWVATKVTQPFRILATLALVPVVARLRRRPSATDPPTGAP